MGYDKPIGVIRTNMVLKNNKFTIDIHEEENLEFAIYYPIKNGIIQDFDKMYLIWNHIFNEKLNINPKTTDILLSLSFSSDNNYTNKIYDIMKTIYNFKQIKIFNQQTLSLYSVGKNFGLVVDIGHDITRIIPIYENNIIQIGIKYSFLAGNSINKYIESTTQIKSIPDKFDKFKKMIFNSNTKKTKFIDFFGKNINRLDWEDLLIDPYLNNYDCDSIPQLIINSINMCPIDIRNKIANNILLIGSTSKIPGLCKKINDGIKNNNVTFNVKVIAPKNRHISSWVGGSIVSCLPENIEKIV